MTQSIPGAFAVADVTFDAATETALHLGSGSYLLWSKLNPVVRAELLSIMTTIDGAATNWVCGADTVRFTGADISKQQYVGIAAGTYTLNINVDGAGAENVSFAVPALATFQSMLDDSLIPAIQAVAGFEKLGVALSQINATTLDLVITTNTPGVAGSVEITAGTGNDIIAAVDAVTWSAAVGAAVTGVDGSSTLDVDGVEGYQGVDVGGGKAGGTATGLANDATVYTASVVVDGGAPQAISVVGSAAQTYTTLLAELNADTTGADWAINGGNLRLTSTSTGTGSTIAITDTDLFATLTGFVAVTAAVPGVASNTWAARLGAVRSTTGGSILDSCGTGAFVTKPASKPASKGKAVQTYMYYDGANWKYYANDVTVGAAVAPPEA
jgi:hypothetical protein